MTFARELWYTVAWSEQIGRSLTPRTIAGDHLVLYRQLSGDVAALSDTCRERPWRFACRSPARRQRRKPKAKTRRTMSALPRL